MVATFNRCPLFISWDEERTQWTTRNEKGDRVNASPARRRNCVARLLLFGTCLL